MVRQNPRQAKKALHGLPVPPQMLVSSGGCDLSGCCKRLVSTWDSSEIHQSRYRGERSHSVANVMLKTPDGLHPSSLLLLFVDRCNLESSIKPSCLDWSAYHREYYEVVSMVLNNAALAKVNLWCPSSPTNGSTRKPHLSQSSLHCEAFAMHVLAALETSKQPQNFITFPKDISLSKNQIPYLGHYHHIITYPH